MREERINLFVEMIDNRGVTPFKGGGARSFCARLLRGLSGRLGNPEPLREGLASNVGWYPSLRRQSIECKLYLIRGEAPRTVSPGILLSDSAPASVSPPNARSQAELLGARWCLRSSVVLGETAQEVVDFGLCDRRQ